MKINNAYKNILQVDNYKRSNSKNEIENNKTSKVSENNSDEAVYDISLETDLEKDNAYTATMKEAKRKTTPTFDEIKKIVFNDLKDKDKSKFITYLVFKKSQLNEKIQGILDALNKDQTLSVDEAIKNAKI